MNEPQTHSHRPGPDERRFLDALCLWRGLYEHRGPQDRLVVATVDDTIAAAELRIRLQRIRNEQLVRRFSSGWPPSGTGR